MRRLVIAALLVVSVAGCGGGSKPDLTACESAMRAQYAAALDSGATGTRPPECHGVSDEQLQEIAARVLATP